MNIAPETISKLGWCGRVTTQVLPLDQFITPLRYAAYTLPVTHGIQLLQDYMLRGSTNEAWELYALLAIGLVLFVVTAVTVRRNLRSAS